MNIQWNVYADGSRFVQYGIKAIYIYIYIYIYEGHMRNSNCANYHSLGTI